MYRQTQPPQQRESNLTKIQGKQVNIGDLYVISIWKQCCIYERTITLYSM